MKSPDKIAEFCVSVGEGKCKMSFLKTFVLAIFAGAFIALAAVACTIAGVVVNKFMGALIFVAGLSMVIIAGSELFTGNCLIFAAVLDKKVSFLSMLRNWGIVYIGNLCGAVFIAFLVVFSGCLDNFSDAVITCAASKATIDFTDALIRGILCNILVCIAVWMAFAAETVTGKIVAIIFPITVFVLCGYEHSVANMFFIPAGLFQKMFKGINVEGLNLFGFFVTNLIPVTLGNIIGGCLVAAGYKTAYLKK